MGQSGGVGTKIFLVWLEIHEMMLLQYTAPWPTVTSGSKCAYSSKFVPRNANATYELFDLACQQMEVQQ